MEHENLPKHRDWRVTLLIWTLAFSVYFWVLEITAWSPVVAPLLMLATYPLNRYVPAKGRPINIIALGWVALAAVFLLGWEVFNWRPATTRIALLSTFYGTLAVQVLWFLVQDARHRIPEATSQNR